MAKAINKFTRINLLWYNNGERWLTMKINKEVKVIRALLNLTQSDLAKDIGVTIDSIIRWEQGYVDTEDRNVELIYNYAYDNGIYINKIYEQILKEECENNNKKILFHGAKNEIIGSIDLLHSKSSNDFGVGFYLGETFEQASTYIANSNSHRVYAYSINLDNLKICEFHVNTEWMLAIAYYRGWIDQYKDHKLVRSIISKVENSDVIVAPIADNRMFDLISEFVDGVITNEQCEHALAATNLGNQYVLRTKNALDKLSKLRECYLSNNEKTEYSNVKFENNNISLNKLKISKIEYRGKGQYIDELLK